MSAVVSAALGGNNLASYGAVIESTVGFFLAFHVCCACTEAESKDKAITPTTNMAFFITKYFVIEFCTAALIQNTVPEIFFVDKITNPERFRTELKQQSGNNFIVGLFLSSFITV